MEKLVSIMKIWMALFLDSFVVHSMDFLTKQDIAVENMENNFVVHAKQIVSTLITDRLSKSIYIVKSFIQALPFFLFFYLQFHWWIKQIQFSSIFATRKDFFVIILPIDCLLHSLLVFIRRI